MVIGAVGGLGQLGSVWQLLSGISGLGAGTSSQAASGNPDLLRPGQIFSKLQQLQVTDPDKLKQALSDIAGKLQTAAAQQPDGPGKEMLARLAGEFKDAATTGDLSRIRLHSHHHRHAHGPSANGTQGPQPFQIMLTLSPQQNGFGGGGAMTFQQALSMENARAALQDALSGVLGTMGV
jgi:hypothetical protein